MGKLWALVRATRAELLLLEDRVGDARTQHAGGLCLDCLLNRFETLYGVFGQVEWTRVAPRVDLDERAQHREFCEGLVAGAREVRDEGPARPQLSTDATGPDARVLRLPRVRALRAREPDPAA